MGKRILNQNLPKLTSFPTPITSTIFAATNLKTPNLTISINDQNVLSLLKYGPKTWLEQKAPKRCKQHNGTTDNAFQVKSRV